MHQHTGGLRRLAPISDLSKLRDACDALHAQQHAAGVIRQDFLNQIQDKFLHDPLDESRCLGFSLNEARINRPQPKPGGLRECPLCEDVIARQRPDQVALPVVMPSGDTMLVLENPFPLVRGGHATISAPGTSTDPHHPGQAWRGENAAAALAQLRRRMLDIGALAAAGAGIVWHNSIGSGASIDHYHHQRLRWPHEQPPPLLAAIERVRGHSCGGACLLGPPDYPVSAAVAVGGVEAAVAALSQVADVWLHGQTAHLTTSLLAFPWGDGETALVFVPRDPRRERVDGLSGAVAAYEITGVLVLSSREDKDLMEAGHYGYTGIWRILESVQDAACRQSVEQLF